MKKIFLLVILIIFSLVALYYYKPVTINYFFGIARILKQENGYQLDINNKKYNNCVFKSTESFDKKRKHNFLILYLRDLDIKSNFEIIVVNLDEKVVGYTCGSFDCYNKVFGSLFQSDMGSFYTPLEDDAKGPGFDTQLKMENKKIDFYIPSERKERLHILLSKK
jgi:hypothetical protein